MKYAYVLAAIFCGLFVGCSEEKKEPLPDLPPVEIPADVFGYYIHKYYIASLTNWHNLDFPYIFYLQFHDDTLYILLAEVLAS